MFCTQCFKEIADISKYCPECGLYIVNNPLDKLEDEFDSKTKKYIFVYAKNQEVLLFVMDHIINNGKQKIKG